MYKTEKGPDIDLCIPGVIAKTSIIPVHKTRDAERYLFVAEFFDEIGGGRSIDKSGNHIPSFTKEFIINPEYRNMSIYGSFSSPYSDNLSHYFEEFTYDLKKWAENYMKSNYLQPTENKDSLDLLKNFLL